MEKGQCLVRTDWHIGHKHRSNRRTNWRGTRGLREGWWEGGFHSHRTSSCLIWHVHHVERWLKEVLTNQSFNSRKPSVTVNVCWPLIHWMLLTKEGRDALLLIPFHEGFPRIRDFAHRLNRLPDTIGQISLSRKCDATLRHCDYVLMSLLSYKFCMISLSSYQLKLKLAGAHDLSHDQSQIQ